MSLIIFKHHYRAKSLTNDLIIGGKAVRLNRLEMLRRLDEKTFPAVHVHSTTKYYKY